MFRKIRFVGVRHLVAAVGVFVATVPVAFCARAEDSTWLYAVQLSATVQTSPPKITLSWPQDDYGADSYTVYRKDKSATSWGTGTALPGSATSFIDFAVSAGAAYEYQVVKKATLGYTGYGYIDAGIEAPIIESRGKIILIVAADTTALAGELSQLQSDLVGDGWSVIRRDVSSSDSPAVIKGLIVNDYWADPAQVNTVFLFGPVPVVTSGSLDYDSHGARPMPADGFYGDIDGNWHLELSPTNRPSYMPSDIELMVGRVDFSDMPGVGAPSPWPSETELLRQYLYKEHRWRHKLVTVPRRAIMANRVGDFFGQAYAASGYRNFQPFVGPGQIFEANVSDSAPNQERWISYVTAGSWLWSFACGAGQDNVISQMGTHGTYHDVWSTDIVGQDAKVVFSMFFGSHYAEWNRTDNVMRAMLAAPGVSLTACCVGLPHWYVHHMSMGETIGYGTRLTMNNYDLYRNQSNALPRCVMIDLLGDPSLRLDQVAPPANLSASGANGSAALSWSTSPDANVGYHVYRAAASPAGPFSRITDAPVSASFFTDSSPFSSSLRTYMVRAMALQTTPAGSYYNLSQGVFATVDVGGSPPPPPPPPPPPNSPILASTSLQEGGIQLSWNSQPGATYHVEAIVLLWNNDWTDISGPLTATSATTSFTDYNWVWYGTRFYRVLSP